jgi:hypothetical protein
MTRTRSTRGCKVIPIRQATGVGVAARPPKEHRCPCGAMTLERAEAIGKAFGHDPVCPFYRERAIIV